MVIIIININITIHNATATTTITIYTTIITIEFIFHTMNIGFCFTTSTTMQLMKNGI